MPPRPIRTPEEMRAKSAALTNGHAGANGKYIRPAPTNPGIKPFIALGLDLSPASTGEHVGECPFCDGSKFHVNSNTGQWECKTCDQSGNAITFMRQIYVKSFQQYDDDGLAELAADRKLLDPKTLTKWGVCKSCLSGEWIVPGYNGEYKIAQLYTYKYVHEINKRVWYGAPKVSEHGDAAQGLFGGHLYDKTKTDLQLVEGIWDAMTLWEINGGRANVLGTPGATILFESWVQPYFANHRVAILYDSDHPKTNKQTGEEEEPRGFIGTKRIAGILKGAATANRPESIKYLNWGPNGYDPTKKSGFDIRDVLTLSQKDQPEGVVARKERDRRLRELLKQVESIPEEWPAVKLGSEEITPIKCESWSEVLTAWKAALHWSTELERVLVTMLACVFSTDIVGDPLWIRILGPAGVGKTTLARGIMVAKKHVLEVSHLTGFHSGYRTDKEGAEDHSLIKKMHGKTVIFKEGDTLLRSGAREKILSEMRDIYDGSSNAHFKTEVNRDYDDIITTFIILGTTNMLELDASECGARFVDCVVLPKKEMETCQRSAEKALENMDRRRGGKQENRGDKDEVTARRLTGGYVEYLREHNCELAGVIKRSMTKEQRDIISKYGIFVAHMRGRPSKTQNEVAEREFGTRLSSQYVRLAVCVAAVTGRTVIDTYVMEIVRGVALDTSRGKCLEVVEYMYGKGQEGLDFNAIYQRFGGKEDNAKELIKYMASPGVKTLERYDAREYVSEHTPPRVKYRLSPEFIGLYNLIMKKGK